MMPPLSTILKKKRAQRAAGIISKDEKKLDILYRKGPAAYGSTTNLQKASKLPRIKVETFMRNKNAHSKYRQFRRKFPRLKVISCDVDEIWSIDVAYVDKLAIYNHGVKFLLVAVDVLSRKLRVESMRPKSAEQTAKSFARMIRNHRKFGPTRKLNSEVLLNVFAKAMRLQHTQLIVKRSQPLPKETSGP